jgi:predicted phage-related endonuclease
VVPGKYQTQIAWQLACTGRKWADFVSFDPRMPASMNMFVKRIHRDDELITQLEKDVSEFLTELRETVHRLRSKYEPDNAELPEVARLLMAG